MGNYRISFYDKRTDRSKNYDVAADDSDDAMKMAYKMPEAKNRNAEIWVSEIQDGPKLIGVRFAYTQFGRPYSQYLFIRAENEEQARAYYRKNIKGKKFYQPWPDKPTDSGNCTYGEIVETYFAIGDADNCPFDATK